ncbi:MAG TPA: sigma-70 family RNA polymerase sigma factor [Verrucomicrobiae bacterium]|nr:sigma-70 family RNA polymerase sigma factor [Verrucomicrobiae bacterium]
MNERQSDFEWLQQFARAGNQNAFRDIVGRHINLVFATALHKTGDAGGAEEISQNVFGILARKAWQFAPNDSLPAWLHKTTLLESKSWLRGEMRRRRREQAAVELGTTMKTSEEQAAFNALVPLLDEALMSLREKDRAALLLRFYEKQPLNTLGATLGVSEDAAQKRVQTALEKLSQFFQRRGYKTASVAAATAALQHTATSVSAATVSTVASAVLQTAPPALAGLGVWLARLATLTKAQTVAVCVMVAAVPVLWQWSEQRDARAALMQAKAKLVAAQNDFSMLQTEKRQLDESAAHSEDALNAVRTAADNRVAIDQKFAAWKQRVRARLLGADYEWPDDLPFVRIPKSILPQLQVRNPVVWPGTIKQETRELLGLSPAEREQAETALHKYMATMDDLMNSERYETNTASRTHIPQDALASEVFGMPALGQTVKESSDELQSALKTTLGAERWPMVEEQLTYSGSDNLRHTLDLDAGKTGQELSVWIGQRNGMPVAGYSWGDQSTSISSYGLALKFFLPEATFPDGRSAEEQMGFAQLPPALTQPAMEWIRQQAATRLQQKGDQ